MTAPAHDPRGSRPRSLPVFAERERAIRAEYAPDVSPGDVIAAEPDGTIVLDDGITTWNPSRAAAFLLAERERLLRRRVEARMVTDCSSSTEATWYRNGLTDALAAFDA